METKKIISMLISMLAIGILFSISIFSSGCIQIDGQDLDDYIQENLDDFDFDEDVEEEYKEEVSQTDKIIECMATSKKSFCQYACEHPENGISYDVTESHCESVGGKWTKMCLPLQDPDSKAFCECMGNSYLDKKCIVNDLGIDEWKYYIDMIKIVQQLPENCAQEHEKIGYGAFMVPSGTCCEGLKAKSILTGGAVCMRPECEIICKGVESVSINTESECVERMLWYDSCDLSEPLYQYDCTDIYCRDKGGIMIEGQCGICYAIGSSSEGYYDIDTKELIKYTRCSNSIVNAVYSIVGG